jgi:hypothetical membrane protein
MAGIVGAGIFWTAPFTFAATYPGYSHLTKAISELGAFGAPHALAWNLIGFIVPGLLLAVCGAGVALAIDGRRTRLFWLLVGSGLGFAGTGIFPIEMHNSSPVMSSPWTSGHILMTFVSGIPWVIAAFVLVGHVKRNAQLQHMKRFSLALGVFAFASLVFNVLARSMPFFAARPGLAQRIAFAAYFAWFLIMALSFLSRTPKVRYASA